MSNPFVCRKAVINDGAGRLSAPLASAIALVLLSFGIASCSDEPAQPVTDLTEPTEASPAEPPGTLAIRANGEDFVRQGFTSKDGWQIDFEHLYVTLVDVTASQADPPFTPGESQALEAKHQVKVDRPVTVDLAAGDESAEPVLIAEIDNAPSGRYNALSWDLAAAESGPSAGYPLVLVGMATKDGETIDFNLKLIESLAFTCGDFIGDERKGFLSGGEQADVEATFHFDHLFGDGEAPADDDINTGALGFQPLADLADGGEIDIDSDGLKQQLSEADYQTLQAILPSLGHVGEGHCEETTLAN